MFTCILTLILMLPVALLPSLLYTFFSSRDLIDMGIRLRDGDAPEFQPKVDIHCTPLSVCL